MIHQAKKLDKPRMLLSRPQDAAGAVQNVEMMQESHPGKQAVRRHPSAIATPSRARDDQP